MQYGHWEYPGEFDPADWFGFIYRIVDLTTGREYLGKKQLHSYTTKPPLKGKTRRRKVMKESDWRKYTSSSQHVNDAIKEKGKENFVFLIESLHENKSSLHYAEVEAQVFEDVLRAVLPCGNRKYFNGMIANIKFLPKSESPLEMQAKPKRKLVIQWMNTDHQHFATMTAEEQTQWREKYRVGDNNYKAIIASPDWEAYEAWLTTTRGPRPD